MWSCWLLAWTACLGLAQQTGLNGIISDPSGRVMPGVSLEVFSLTGRLTDKASSNAEGRYEIVRLAPGSYTLRAAAAGFVPLEMKVSVPMSVTGRVDLTMSLAPQSERVNVTDLVGLELNPQDNSDTGGALVLRGKDLEALASNRDELTADLLALAGPAAGPSGAQIFIDGFSGGRMPRKASIQEVRINSNPFAAQFDSPGFGRIEIFTKPGQEDFHGEFVVIHGDDALNSRNPFAPFKPAYRRQQYEADVSGPLGKRTAFQADVELRRNTENAFINALTLDSGLNVQPIQTALLTPLRGYDFSGRIDHQLSKNHILMVGFEQSRDERQNQGAGAFSLASRAFASSDQQDIFQMRHSGTYGSRTINESRFRYLRSSIRQEGGLAAATVDVLDAFTGGGAPQPLSFNTQQRYELHNISSHVRGTHVWRGGLRLRGIQSENQDTQGYPGTFTFASLAEYRITLLGQRSNLSPQQIRASGGGAMQFTQNAGDPLARIGQVDVGVFVQDDWRLRPNLSLSFGLRYEKQNNIRDAKSIAPRLGLAWGMGPAGKAPKTVFRLGAGIFYERVGENLSLDARRQNGIQQQRFLVQSPDFYPAIPTLSQLSASEQAQTVRLLDASIVAPRIYQTGLGFERGLAKKTTLSSNFVFTLGQHQLRSRNLSAPGAAARYNSESTGRYRQQQWITTLTARPREDVSLSATYTLNQAKSDTDGLGSFPGDPANLRAEYGRAAYDIRHRFQLNGSLGLPWDIRLSPLLIVSSGRPFNITLGRDLNGDTVFSERPGLSTAAGKAGLIPTRYGLLDPNPEPGQALLARNAGSGPLHLNINLRLAKTFRIGKVEKTAGKKASDPKEITFSASARNLLNRQNLGQPVGNLSSLLFLQSTALAAGQGSSGGNRRIDLQVVFSF